MSESNEEMENQSSDEYQVQIEEWDEAFRGTLHTSARSERIASGNADPIQREAAAYFTPQRKRKPGIRCSTQVRTSWTWTL